METTTARARFLERSKTFGYTSLRLAIGMSMLIHGVARFPKLSVFAQQTVKMFAGSPLPAPAVELFARVTPFVEFAIGLSVLLGLATIWGLTCGGLWMVVLIFGSTLIEKYDIVGIQLIYSIIFFELLLRIEHNEISLDTLIERRAKT